MGKIHTTNYYNTLIEVSEDTKATSGTKPPSKTNRKTVAEQQYELLATNPYKFTSDEVFFHIYADRNELSTEEHDIARATFFSKGQPCFRASPLPKTYGFGVHSDSNGKIAIVGMETSRYHDLINDPGIKKVKAMRTTKK
ncbi:MAG: hypothetical protein JJU02_04615 [Cryomorphaceae bacterium]|nr:hypothetical protein [Cryomorphaceae bacterium]